MATRILIVEDHPVFRAGLMALLNQQNDMEACGEAESCNSAWQIFEAEQPDVVIIDLSLAEGSGLQLIKKIRSDSQTTKILVASMYEETAYGERCINIGANGYINKREAASNVIDAIRRILKGKTYLSKNLKDRMQHQKQPSGSGYKTPLDSFTNRELEIYTLIGRGLTNKKIASLLNLSSKTVDNHRDNIKKKLAVADNTALIRSAVQWLADQ